MTAYSEKMIKAHRTLLARWQGCLACIEEYTSSHKMLELKLFRRETPESFLRVQCLEPELVCFVPGWSDAHVDIAVMGFADPARETWIVADARASFFVRAGKVEVKETIHG